MRSIENICKYNNRDGRITIPRELRRDLRLEGVSEFKVYAEDSNVIIRPVYSRCSFCGESDNLIEVGKYLFCKKCYKDLRDAILSRENGK